MPKKNGFTLIELMVVIAIIAILSVIGISIYGNAQKSVRDARRKGDVEAIASAYEQNYDPIKNKYKLLATTDFQNGKFPTPPENPTTYYDGFNSNDYFDTTNGKGSSWMVCAQLEGRTQGRCTNATDSNCYCRSSTQGKTEIAAIGSGSVLFPAPGGGTIPVSPIPIDGLVLWLRAEDIGITDISQVSAGSVIKWVASPYCTALPCAKDAVKKGTYNTPTYVAGQIGVLNNKPLVRFNGSQALEVPSPLTSNTFFTLIFVGKYYNGYPLSLGEPPWESNAPNAGFYVANFSYLFQGISGSNINRSTTNNFPDWWNTSTATIVTLAFNGNFSCYLISNPTNCSGGNTGVITNTPLTEKFNIGAIFALPSIYWGTANFAEIILYNRPLVGSAALDSDRNQVINYLKSKYAFQ